MSLEGGREERGGEGRGGEGREGGRERGWRGGREGRGDCYTYYSDGTTIYIYDNDATYYVITYVNIRLGLRRTTMVRRGDRGWLTNFALKVRFSKNCIIFANYHSVHTF